MYVFFVKPMEGGLLGPHHLQVNYRTKMTLGIKSRPDLLRNFLTIHVQLQLTCTWSGSYFQRCLYVLKNYLRRNCQHAFLMRSSTNWFSFFLLMSTAYLHSSKLTVIEFGDGCSFGHIFLSALRTNSLRFQAFLSAVFCLHQICSSSITQFSPLLLFPITK